MILIFVTNQEIYPANVASVILGIKGVLEMESFPKEYFIDKIVGNSKDKILPQNGLLQNLSIFALLIVILLLFVGLLLIVSHLTRKYKKVAEIVQKIKKIIIWNMVIKTFQAGFLAYIFGAVKSIVTYCFEQGRSSSQITDLVLGILLFNFLCGICVSLHRFIMKNEALVMC